MNRPPKRHLTLVVPEPLPECELCERPTRRDAFEANGRLCTDCAEGIARAAALLPPATS